MKIPQNNRKTDQQLIEMIIQGGRSRNSAIGELLKQTDLKVKSVLSKMGLNQMDIEEMHNDALILCIENICEGKYKQMSSISTYIVGISVLLTKNQLRKNKRRTEFDYPEQEEISISPEEIIEMEEKNQKLHDALDRLGPPCNELLLLWANGYSFKEIVNQLHYSTENSAKVQKFKCLKRLIEIVGGDKLL